MDNVMICSKKRDLVRFLILNKSQQVS